MVNPPGWFIFPLNHPGYNVTIEPPTTGAS
jgi:hypothetical protein